MKQLCKTDGDGILEGDGSEALKDPRPTYT